jgi:hypothetical protein
MKLLSKNITFLKHKTQIQEAVDLTSGLTRTNGKDLFREMIIAADELDLMMAPISGARPDPHLATVKRDNFHKKCRDMGVWLEEHAPSLKLDWN